MNIHQVLKMPDNGSDHMDNKSSQKIESSYKGRSTALEEQNENFKMEIENLKMEIESLKKVSIWEDKSVYTPKLAIFKKSMMSYIQLSSLFDRELSLKSS